MDQAFQAVGEHGPFQKMTIIIVSISSLLVTIYTLSFSYLTKLPEFLCKDTSFPNAQFHECKYSKELCNSNIEMIKNPETSVKNWAYDFDLYCSREYYNDLISTSFFTGGIIGTITFSSLPDKYGRKKLFQILLCVSCFLHLNLFLIISPIHMMFVYFLGGFFSFAYGMCFYIVSEYLPSSITGTVMGILNALYPLGGIFIGLFFIYVNSWRMLYFIFFIFHVLITYLTLKYFTESPRWLNAMGKKEECLLAMENIAKINGNLAAWEQFKKNNTNFIEGDKTNHHGNNNKSNDYSLIQIIGFKSQRKNFLLMAYIWMASSFCFFGIILNLGRMEGNFFTNSIFAFTGEMISESSTGYLSGVYGRLNVMKYSAYLGSTCFLLYMFVPHSIGFIMIFASMMGYAGIFNVIAVYSPEIFPTPIRGITCSFLLLICRFSPLSVPPLSQFFQDNVNYVFIIAGYCSAIFCYFLEESLGKPLPDVIPEEVGKESFLMSSSHFDFSERFDIISDHNTSLKSMSFRM